MTCSLYGDLLAAGVETANHMSDLYFPDTEQTRAILARFPYSAGIAAKFRDNKTGQTWWDVPFAFLPWWEKHARDAALLEKARI